MVVKIRLDSILVKRGFFSSLKEADAAILAGLVKVAGVQVDKPGVKFDPNAEIQIKAVEKPYASRGALKLEKAIAAFGVKVRGKVFIDAGASSGGFTDYLLRNGAKKIVAVDVGYGQLAWGLRQNAKVQVLERQNVRYLRAEQLEEIPDAAVLDLSFISILKVIPSLLKILKSPAEIIALVKPQFEIDQSRVEKGGLVTKKESHQQVLADLWRQLIELDLKVKGITFSPVRGAEGNMEFFLYLVRGKSTISERTIEQRVKQIVDEAHEALGKKKT